MHACAIHACALKLLLTLLGTAQRTFNTRTFFAHFQQRFFAAEAALVGRLQHPNVVQILDAVADDDLPYLVMEFVPGKSLARSTQGHIVEFGQSLTIIDAVCEGLAYAHDAGLVHGLHPRGEGAIEDRRLGAVDLDEHVVEPGSIEIGDTVCDADAPLPMALRRGGGRQSRVRRASDLRRQPAGGRAVRPRRAPLAPADPARFGAVPAPGD